MNKINISEEQSAMLNLIGHNLFGMPVDVPSEIDWSEVLKESISQSMPLIAFQNIDELPIGVATTAVIKKYLKRCEEVNLACYRGHSYLHRLMSENGISYSVIKGVASARYYPDPILRSMGDVDFYVAPEHLERAREVFKSDGFTLEHTDSEHHDILERGKLYMELHFAPIAIPDEKMKPIFLEYWSDLCESATTVKDDYGEYKLPSDFHHGFIILTHFQMHLMPIGVGLRHLCDWAVFVNSFSNEEFVDTFEKRLKRVGLWRLGQAIALAAVKYLGMPHKAWMGDDYDVADALLEDIARGGNFGQRDKERSFETVFIADYKATAGEKSRIVRAFRFINNYIRQHWPAAKWCILLYPVGWIFFPLRFLWRRITGQRSANVVESYKQSGKRLAMYKRLELYKPQK
ncbi:MAG: nucleotidyltransferase family protein [Clostridia bacterium]|nr:nucleotidyltransferase family protein [Clostridia bacterium]